MNKRYFWIYVLPILMVTTIIGFGVLGVKSAVYEQKMQTELAKIEWKMDAVEIYDENRPYYDKATDIIEVIWYDMENHWVGKRFFSSNPIELTWEDVDEREKRLNLMDAEGRKAIVNENLQCKKEYGKELLAFSDFDDNLALLYFRDKLLCVDENVNIVFEKKTRIRDYYADDSYDEKNSIVEGLNVDGFVDGLAVFTLDGCRYGVLDCEGNILLDPVFKGKNSLTVMKNQHVAVFYEGEFCIGKIKTASGGMKNE